MITFWSLSMSVFISAYFANSLFFFCAGGNNLGKVVKEAGVPLEQSKPHGMAQQLSKINTKINSNISNNTYNAGTKHTLKYKKFRQAAHLQYITCN